MILGRRFFCADDGVNGRINISGDEYHHVRTVLRARVGDAIEIVNGRGRLYTGHIHTLSAAYVSVAIDDETTAPAPPVRVIIAPSLTRQHAMNWMIEKLCELGVDEIRPLQFERTDVKYAPSCLQRWQKAAIQAIKVNKKLWPTRIYPAIAVSDLPAAMGHVSNRILLDLAGEPVPLQGIGYPVVAVIGPPGDITAAEREQLQAAQFVCRRIGTAVLKTDTAALVAAVTLQHD